MFQCYLNTPGCKAAFASAVPITHMAWSPDGKYLFYVEGDDLKMRSLDDGTYTTIKAKFLNSALVDKMTAGIYGAGGAIVYRLGFTFNFDKTKELWWGVYDIRMMPGDRVGFEVMFLKRGADNSGLPAASIRSLGIALKPNTDEYTVMVTDNVMTSFRRHQGATQKYQLGTTDIRNVADIVYSPDGLEIAVPAWDMYVHVIHSDTYNLRWSRKISHEMGQMEAHYIGRDTLALKLFFNIARGGKSTSIMFYDSPKGGREIGNPIEFNTALPYVNVISFDAMPSGRILVHYAAIDGPDKGKHKINIYDTISAPEAPIELPSEDITEGWASPTSADRLHDSNDALAESGEGYSSQGVLRPPPVKKSADAKAGEHWLIEWDSKKPALDARLNQVMREAAKRVGITPEPGTYQISTTNDTLRSKPELIGQSPSCNYYAMYVKVNGDRTVSVPTEIEANILDRAHSIKYDEHDEKFNKFRKARGIAEGYITPFADGPDKLITYWMGLRDDMPPVKPAPPADSGLPSEDISEGWMSPTPASNPSLFAWFDEVEEGDLIADNDERVKATKYAVVGKILRNERTLSTYFWEATPSEALKMAQTHPASGGDGRLFKIGPGLDFKSGARIIRKNVLGTHVTLPSEDISEGWAAQDVIEFSAPTPEAKRARKKRRAVSEISHCIGRLRKQLRRDIKSGNSKLADVAAAVIIIDHTAERVGNSGSAKDGHYGVTGLQCRHVSVHGHKVRLRYVGKSGVSQDKHFTDRDVARIIKARLASCKKRTDPIMDTSAERVNRYLTPFNITAKDIRGHHANQIMAGALLAYKGRLQGRKERKKVFLSEIKKSAAKVGHTPATLRKHYLLDGFESNYLDYGKIPPMLKND